MRIMFDKIDGFIRAGGNKLRHLVLFDYGLFGKIYVKISGKTGITEIVLIIILKKSELIHIILYILKKYWLCIML